MEKVKVVAPATLSNLGSGFDVFGMALAEPFDHIEARKTSEPGVTIEAIEGWGAEGITTDATLNSAGVAAAEVLKKCEADFGIALTIKRGSDPVPVSALPEPQPPGAQWPPISWPVRNSLPVMLLSVLLNPNVLLLAVFMQIMSGPVFWAVSV